MYYDLYGRGYPNRRDAENAEMAQCAAIDADLAYRKIEELERQINSQQQQPTEQEFEINMLYYKIESLEDRITKLETLINWPK